MEKDAVIIALNDSSFAYDVHSLFQAFYPQLRILVRTECEDADFLKKSGSEDTPGNREEALKSEQTGKMVLGDCKGKESSEKYDWAIEINEDIINMYEKADTHAPILLQASAPTDRAGKKNVLKLLIYDALCKKEGRTLPWGTLTGIRPTKLAMRKIEDGATKDEVVRFMEETYRTSRPKIELAYEIAKREHAIIETCNSPEGYSLYIGIPFCPSICMYCSFSSYPISAYQDLVEDYLKALFKEMDAVAEMFADRRLTSIYIGGGTPTSLNENQLEKLLNKVETTFNTTDAVEFTVESGRPDSLNTAKLEAVKTHFNGKIRISINPQTMNNDTLRRIGRHHTAADIIEAYELARSLSIDMINMDLIIGLPGEDVEAVKRTLREIEKLKPDNLTVHSLAIKRSSHLHEMLVDGRASYEKAIAKNADAIMEAVYASAAVMGMKPYYMYRQKNITGNLENIGFAPEGKEGLYNILIMEEVQDIVALGAGAACKCLVRDENGIPVKGAKIKRCENVKDVASYIERIDEMIERKYLFGRPNR